MPFFDLHIHSAFSEGHSSLEDLALMAKRLNYSGICFSAYYKNEDQIKKLQEEIQKVKEKIKIELFLGFEARNPKELEILRQRRKKFDLLLVHGGDLKLNRLACETPEVDILTHPEFERMDSGLNHVLMKSATKNNVAIEVNFREILLSDGKSRSFILKNMQENVKLAKKFKTPIVICSGAVSTWEMKDPQVLISLGNQLGMTLEEAKNSVSKIPEKILKEIKERSSERWVMPGVKVIR